MSNVQIFVRPGRTSAAAGVIAAAVALAGAMAFAQTAPTIGQLYQAASSSYEGRPANYEKAAAEIVARGQEAVSFLVELLGTQAERVRDAGEVKTSGILVTINLLGRMNSFPEARRALTKLREHPVGELGRWANFALARTPQTRPVRPPPAVRAPASRPGEPAVPSRRVDGDRIRTPEGWFARPEVTPPPLPETVTRAFVLPVREEIKSKTFDALRRKAVRCRAGGAELIVLDMDTWGGEVGAALDIARLLKNDLKDIYTVCYVRTRGVSAGALIALACDEILITPNAKLGDCAPLLAMGKLEGVEREKIETVLRNEFRDSAQTNGYGVALSESMVTIGREVWLIRNETTEELRYVDRRDWIAAVKAPPGLTTAPTNPASEWELLRVVVPAGELLTMTSRESVEYGFASSIIDAPREKPLAALLEHFNVAGEPTVLPDTWSEGLVDFLMHPAMLGFLVFVALLCAYVEINTPGFGIPGAVAILCFAIVFGSRFLTGLANWWEIGLFVVGVILLLVEVFITPGFGVLGSLGILCCVVGLLAMVVPNAPDKLPWPHSDLDWSVFKSGVLALVLALLAVVPAAAGVARYLPKVPVAGKLVLAPPKPVAVAPATEDASILQVRAGQVGRVVQRCRPVGKVQIGDELVDAIADGAFLTAGTEVVVLRNEGNRVVVQARNQ